MGIDTFISDFWVKGAVYGRLPRLLTTLLFWDPFLDIATFITWYLTHGRPSGCLFVDGK